MPFLLQMTGRKQHQMLGKDGNKYFVVKECHVGTVNLAKGNYEDVNYLVTHPYIK